MEFDLAASPSQITHEIRLRRDFVMERLGRKAARNELKDLIDFMHGFPALLVQCKHCGSLVRDEQSTRQADSYEEDPNSQELMAHLLPRYIEAFRHKERVYRPLLKPNADVLEIGSHLGAFLHTASEWSWNAVALDVGQDTAGFARRRGFRVFRDIVEQAPLRPGSFDAVFVWNCFEQLPEPGPSLTAIHRLLKPHGLLVIRVPNALFYRVLAPELRCASPAILHALGYNNLLGFPYLYGYTAPSLNRLLARYAFEPVHGVNSELVTMPFPDPTVRTTREQEAISHITAGWSAITTAQVGSLTGPWIEVTYRRLAGAVPTPARLTRRKIDLRFLERAA